MGEARAWLGIWEGPKAPPYPHSPQGAQTPSSSPGCCKLARALATSWGGHRYPEPRLPAVFSPLELARPTMGAESGVCRTQRMSSLELKALKSLFDTSSDQPKQLIIIIVSDQPTQLEQKLTTILADKWGSRQTAPRS